MYSFEGEYRRKPEQCLSGASTVTERNELLQHAKQQRQKREEHRKKARSAVLIQAYTRGYLTRDHVKKSERSSFDGILKECNKTSINYDVLSTLVKKLLFFYSEQEDGNRLVLVSQYLLKSYSDVLELASDLSNPWTWYIQGILNLNLGHIEALVKQNSSESIAVPLRILETFTSYEITERILGCDKANYLMLKIFSYLISKGYFKHLRFLLDKKTPPLLDALPKPPNPLVGCLYMLLIRPLNLSTSMSKSEYSKLLQEFCLNIFSPKLTESIKCFVLPALVELQSFPFLQVLDILQSNPPNSSLKGCESDYYTTGMLYSILTLDKKHFWLNVKPNVTELSSYLQVLASLTFNICKLNVPPVDELDGDDVRDMDVDDDDYTVPISMKEELEILEECVNLLNEAGRVQNLLLTIDKMEDLSVLQALCQVCHMLLISNELAVHKYRLLYKLAFKPTFLRHLWSAIQGINQESTFGCSAPLINVISRGIPVTAEEENKIVPLLAVFCSLFGVFIATLHDSEFYGDEDESGMDHQTMPFTLSQVVIISRQLKEICLGLVHLAFPDARLTLKESIQGIAHNSISTQQTRLWSNLFKVTVALVRQLHARDSRRPFCPEDHWISREVQITLGGYKPTGFALRMLRLRNFRPFQSLGGIARDEEDGGPPLTTEEIRTATLLHELPFLVSFQERVMVFQTKVSKDKMEHQGERARFLQGPSIQISVRRNFLYEDAFDKLSLENEPEMRLIMRVQLVNKVGLDEAGVDGGGVFREFLSELLKTAFDPNRGFFRLTKDNLLYPNPNVHLLVEDFPKHYFFIGRMLGKALYENLLVELPFAEFFLSKLVGRHSNVDIHHLASFDPVMYRNLLFLKNYEGDVLDLGLDFIIMNEDLGETRIIELKPGGSSIPVTSSNRIEYIHLVADYKLNKQIRAQCNAFRQGLANVIPPEWIQMFNNKELQVLISGAEIPVDLDDLKQHTNYTGGYSDDHPTIKIFWDIVEGFSDIQRRQLLKFVTSCSRPPLLGFKELDPPFCIQHAGSADRLPTASTCMNLLKLPEFSDEKSMSEKLMYAIQSGAGFELS